MNCVRVVAWTVIGAVFSVALSPGGASLSGPGQAGKAVVGALAGFALGLALSALQRAVEKSRAAAPAQRRVR